MNPWLVLAVLESMLLPYVSTLPAHTGPVGTLSQAVGSSTILHIFAYTLYGFLLANALARNNRSTFFAVLALGAGMGFLTEALQFAAPTRTPDIMDWAADVFGTLAGSTASSARYRIVRVFRTIRSASGTAGTHLSAP